MSVEYCLCGRTYKGGRENNEDNLLLAKVMSYTRRNTSVDDLSSKDIILLTVADGVGGLSAGEVASTVFVDVMKREFMHMNEKISEVSEEVIKLMVQAFKKANIEILNRMRTIGKKGGTTGTAVLAVDDLLHVIHVGDSRAYVVHSEGIDMLTEDHSVAWRDFKKKIEPELRRSIKTTDIAGLRDYYRRRIEYLQNHPDAHTITNVLGYYGDVEPSTLIIRMPRESMLLLTTDGLTDLLDEYEIYEETSYWLDKIIPYKDKEYATRICNIMIDRLIKKAMERNPHDNITIALAYAMPV